MKMFIVFTSHEQLGDTGKKTGFWLEEFAAPYYVLNAGATITLASPKGGQPPLDPKSDLPENLTQMTKGRQAWDGAEPGLFKTRRPSVADSASLSFNNELTHATTRSEGIAFLGVNHMVNPEPILKIIWP